MCLLRFPTILLWDHQYGLCLSGSEEPQNHRLFKEGKRKLPGRSCKLPHQPQCQLKMGSIRAKQEKGGVGELVTDQDGRCQRQMKEVLVGMVVREGRLKMASWGIIVELNGGIQVLEELIYRRAGNILSIKQKWR